MLTDWCRFAIGEAVLWHHESRGGYGFISHVPAVVVGVGAKRVKIDAKRADGGVKSVWVTLDHLRLPSENCAMPVCRMSRD